MWYVLPLGLASVLALLIAIRAVLGRLSGWEHLASRFAVRQGPKGWQWRRQTIGVDAVRYRGCANVSAAPEGLYVEVALFHRRPLLCIPWGELRNPTPARLYSRPAVQLAIGSSMLRLPLELYRAAVTAPGSASAPDCARSR